MESNRIFFQCPPLRRRLPMVFLGLPVCAVTPLFAQVEDEMAADLSPAVAGESAAEVTAASDAAPSLFWTPPEPLADVEFDWVQMNSGEWLKGEIKAIYNDVMEFDSDGLDLLELDMEDIAVIRSASLISINVGNRRPVTGRIVVDNKTVTVFGDGTSTSIPRSRVVSATAANPRPLDRWSAKVSLGANLRGGNTEQIEYNTRVNLLRRTALSRFSFEYQGNVSETNQVQSADNHRINSFLDFYINRKWFVRPANLEYFRDTFQNIEHRFTAAAGFGYQIIDANRFEWDLFAGPGYLYTQYVDSAEGQGKSSLAGLLSTSFDWGINNRQDLAGRYNVTLTEKGAGGYIHNIQLTLENEITSDFDIDITFIWDHVSNPETGNDGTRPDDFRLLFALGYEL